MGHTLASVPGTAMKCSQVHPRASRPVRKTPVIGLCHQPCVRSHVLLKITFGLRTSHIPSQHLCVIILESTTARPQKPLCEVNQGKDLNGESKTGF